MHQTVANSLIFEQEEVLSYAELDKAHPRNSQQICLKAGKCLVCTILNALLKFGTGGQVVPLGFDLWPREKCPKEFNFSPKVTL